MLKCKEKRNERKNKNQRNRKKEKKLRKKDTKELTNSHLWKGGGFIFDSKIYLEF